MRSSNGKALAHAELKPEWFQTKLAEEIAEKKNSSPALRSDEAFLC